MISKFLVFSGPNPCPILAVTWTLIKLCLKGYFCPFTTKFFLFLPPPLSIYWRTIYTPLDHFHLLHLWETWHILKPFEFWVWGQELRHCSKYGDDQISILTVLKSYEAPRWVVVTDINHRPGPKLNNLKRSLFTKIFLG